MEMRPPGQPDVTIRDFTVVLRDRWRVVMLITAASLLLTGLVVMFKKPLYQSKAMIQVESEQPRFMLSAERPSVDERLNSHVSSEMEILRSRLVLDPVIQDLGLEAVVKDAKPGLRIYLKEFQSTYSGASPQEFKVVFGEGRNYEAFDENLQKLGTGELGVPFSGGGVRWLLDAVGMAPGDAVVFEKILYEDAVVDLQEKLEIEEVGKETNLLSVSIDLPDAESARELIRRLTESYLAQNVERKSLEASQTLAFLEDQLLLVQGNMEASEKELNAIKSERGIFILSEDAKRIIEQITKLELTKIETQLRQSQMQQISVSLKDGINDSYLVSEVGASNTLIATLASDLSQRLLELRGLRQNATVKHPGVMALEAQIQELKNKIMAAVNNSKTTLGSQVVATDRLIGKYEAQLKTLPNAEREMAALTRKSEVNGDLYSFLLKKHEEARIAQAGIVGNIRIVEAGSLPLKPASPNKPRALALALIAGLLLGAGFAFVAEYFDDTLSAAEDIETRFGLGVFGEIPVFPDLGRDAGFMSHRADPRSSVHEAFRALATNIRFAGAHAGIKRITCTSTELGEGKTTVIVNLAVTLAERGSRVLLIDCDLRRPCIHTLFKLPAQPGLTNAILGELPWQDMVMRSGIQHLSVLPAGVTPPNQAELLDSPALNKILDEASAKYDYILVDVPPVMAFTDAAIVSTRVDAVFLIAAASQTRSPSFRRSLDVLRNVKAPVRGAIVTRSKSSPGSEEYYRARDRKDARVTLRSYGQRLRNLLLRV